LVQLFALLSISTLFPVSLPLILEFAPPLVRSLLPNAPLLIPLFLLLLLLHGTLLSLPGLLLLIALLFLSPLFPPLALLILLRRACGSLLLPLLLLLCVALLSLSRLLLLVALLFLSPLFPSLALLVLLRLTGCLLLSARAATRLAFSVASLSSSFPLFLPPATSATFLGVRPRGCSGQDNGQKRSGSYTSKNTFSHFLSFS
jgi:hypothetical protein